MVSPTSMPTKLEPLGVTGRRQPRGIARSYSKPGWNVTSTTVLPNAGIRGLGLGAVLRVEEPLYAGPIVDDDRRVRPPTPILASRWVATGCAKFHRSCGARTRPRTNRRLRCSESRNESFTNAPCSVGVAVLKTKARPHKTGPKLAGSAAMKACCGWLPLKSFMCKEHFPLCGITLSTRMVPAPTCVPPDRPGKPAPSNLGGLRTLRSRNRRSRLCSRCRWHPWRRPRPPPRPHRLPVPPPPPTSTAAAARATRPPGAITGGPRVATAAARAPASAGSTTLRRPRRPPPPPAPLCVLASFDACEHPKAIRTKDRQMTVRDTDGIMHQERRPIAIRRAACDSAPPARRALRARHQPLPLAA